MNNTIHPSKIYQFILIGVILILAWTLWKELNFLFPSLLGAIALYILLKDPMFWLMNQKNMKDWIAATLLIVATLIIIVVPLWFIIKLLIIKIEPLVASPDFFTDVFRQINAYLKDELGLAILTQDTLMKMSGKLTTFAQEILSGTLRQVVILVFMYIFLFFMMVNGRRMEIFLRRNMPFSRENTGKVLNEVTRMVRSNAITIPSVAFLQGTVALIGYIIFGINEPLLLGVITAIASMIPVIGALIVYLPVVIYTLATGSVGAGIGLGLWCFILVGSVDNVARFMLQRKLANIHPLITILGVILGTKLFGLIGLIFGPLIITLFVVLVKIYFNEFGNLTAPIKYERQK
ncbi:MAG: AI-2E family transporter [Porphyromonadaceae bacterium]|nr:MAG: AI-2E family transporter [Porphyromonadaceae bacterium]